MQEQTVDAIYDEILSDPDFNKIFYMKESNSSEVFDSEKALETARKSNFAEVMNDLCLEALIL